MAVGLITRATLPEYISIRRHRDGRRREESASTEGENWGQIILSIQSFGQIKQKNNILTTVVEGKIEGKRPRGYPCNKLVTDIKE